MELRQGKHPTLSVAFTVSTLSSLYPFSLSRQSSSDQRTGKRLQTHWPMRVTVIPIDFFPLSLSLAVSTIQFLPSCVSLSSFLLCTEREKEGKSFFSWRKRGKNSSLFFFFQREREREGKKEKIGKEESSEEHLLLVARRIEGEVSWPEPWVQQGAPGEIPSHGYWFTMPRIIRHYLMWYMGSRGQRFSRLERERERERSAC